MFVCLFVCLFACLLACLLACLFVCLCACACMFVCFPLVCPIVCLCMCLCLCLCVCVCVRPCSCSGALRRSDPVVRPRRWFPRAVGVWVVVAWSCCVVWASICVLCWLVGMRSCGLALCWRALQNRLCVQGVCVVLRLWGIVWAFCVRVCTCGFRVAVSLPCFCSRFLCFALGSECSWWRAAVCSTSLPGGNQVDGLPPAPVDCRLNLRTL